MEEFLSLRFITLNTVPPGGFRYFVSNTGRTVEAPTWPDLLDEVAKHLKANAMDVPGNIADQIQEQLCEKMPAGICNRDVPSQASSGLTFDQIKTGTATLVEWFMTGKTKVSRDEAQRRAAVCASCPNNKPPQGCSACAKGGFMDMVNVIVGGEHIPGDSMLEGCTVCGCSLRAKIWLPLDLIQKRTKPEINSQFPEWCWAKKKEGAA